MKKHTLIRFLAAVAATVATTAALAAPTGVTINGFALDDAVSTNGPGWTYASPTLTLTNAGPFTLSGANTASKVNVVVPENVTNTVTLSNLTLTGTAWGQRAFRWRPEPMFAPLAGKNVLVPPRAGRVSSPDGRVALITNAPGNTAARSQPRAAATRRGHRRRLIRHVRHGDHRRHGRGHQQLGWRGPAAATASRAARHHQAAVVRADTAA